MAMFQIESKECWVADQDLSHLLCADVGMSKEETQRKKKNSGTPVTVQTVRITVGKNSHKKRRCHQLVPKGKAIKTEVDYSTLGYLSPRAFVQHAATSDVEFSQRARWCSGEEAAAVRSCDTEAGHSTAALHQFGLIAD